MLTIGSLFSGIGGFDLGLERAGMRTVWFCEQDAFCQRVLARHWPGVPVHSDVCALVADANGSDGWRRPASGRIPQAPGAGSDEGGDGPVMPVPVPYVDVLCGGFPCQDLSYAGHGAGLDGARSGLWSEYARLIGELGPRYVVVENVAALLARGLGTVLADLAALGYDAEWDCIPASAVGAPHRRDRIWLVAYPNGQGQPGVPVDARPGRGLVVPLRDPDAEVTGLEGAGLRGRSADVRAAGPDADRGRLQERGEPHGGQQRPGLEASQRDDAHRLREVVADADSERAHRPGTRGAGRDEPADGHRRRGVGHADRAPEDAHAAQGRSRGAASEPGWWSVEPDVGRVAHGVSARVDRLRSLGNALVPQIAEWIGGRILDYEEGRLAA